MLWVFALGINTYGINSPQKPVEPILRVYEHPDISTPPILVIEPEQRRKQKIRTGYPEGNRSFARSEMDKWVWGDEQFECLVNLWERESNWNHEAKNPNSSAYGIPQALPGHKMSTVGEDWKTNPETQIKWGLKYIKERYQNPCNAWNHFQNKNWY